MALDESDKAALAAKLGTDRSGVVDLMLDDPTRVDGAMDDIAREKRVPDAPAPEPEAVAEVAPEAAEAPALTPRKAVTPEKYSASVRKMYEKGGRPPRATALIEDEDIEQRRAALAEGAPAPQATLPIDAPMTGAIPGAVTGAAGQVIPAPVQLPGAPQAAAPAPLFPTTQEEMVRELDQIGIGERAKVRRRVNSGEIATPESFIAELGKTRIDKADVKARRDNRIDAMREALRTAAADPAVDRVVAQIDEVRQYAEATRRLTAWFDANASDDLKLADSLDKGDREAQTLPASAVRSILALVETTKDSGDVTPAVAAVRYFGRTGDPGYALHMIAHDAAQARGKPKHRIPKVWDKNSILGVGVDAQTENDRATMALLDGQGYGTAAKAVKWVKDNLSPEVYAQLIAMQDRRAGKERAGYAWIDYGKRSEARDKVRGKTAAGRVGPAQAVNEPTEAEIEARENKIRKDREAFEDTARQYLGLTPEQWQVMSAEVRQERVLDYMDLLELDRRSSATELPEAIAPREEVVAPQRRALPRRKLSPRQEALEQLREEIEATAEQTGGPAELDFGSFAGGMEWTSDAHPRATALIRAGDFKGALRVLAATTAVDDLRQLAQKLLARIGDTRSQVVSPEVMDRIRATISPETPTLGVETPGGVYVHPLNETQLDAMRREGHNEAADLIEQYGGQILFNETSPIAPELVMHEAVHRVADAALANPSHPLSRQLDKLRTNLLKFMPANEYGLSNVRELLTAGMTNPVFRRNLSYVNTEGKPYSAWQEFKHIMRNFLRSIMGRPTVKPDTALTTLDRALDAVLAMNPNEMQSGDIVGASFAPGGLRDRVIDATKNARVPTAADVAEVRTVMEDVAIDPKWRDMFARFLQPLNLAARAASKYLPSSEAMVDTIRQHRAAQNEASERVARTVKPIAEAIRINSRDPETLKNMEIVRLIGSAEEVNVVTKTEQDYKGYSFRYNVLDADGNIVRTVESKRYKTELERNKALQAYNATLPPDAPKRARARRSFDEKAETLAVYQRLKTRFDTLPPELKKALARAYDLPNQERKRLDAAIKATLEALAPQSKAIQNKLYSRIYAKIAAENLVDPYQNLSRRGNYWLAYSQYDPITGQTELVKNSFTSLQQQQTAYRMLLKQNERYYAAVQRAMGDTRPLAEFRAAVEGIPANPTAGTPAVKPTLQIPKALSERIIEGTDTEPGIPPALAIHPYQETKGATARHRPPIEFMAKVFDMIDSESAFAGLVDPATGKGVDAKEKLLDLLFDATPEQSFLQMFRKRAGRRGFENDFTLLQQDVTAGDIIANISDANLRLARTVVDLEYGAKLSSLRSQLDKEYKVFKNAPPPGVSPRKWMREQSAALNYLNAMNEWSRTPFQTRSQAARTAVSATYIATLGLNPSTAFLTTASLPMVFAPYVGPIYGFRNTVKAVGIASKMIGASGRVRRVEQMGLDGNTEIVDEKRPIYDYSFDNRDYTLPENAFLKTAHQIWKKNGMMHSTLTYDELMGETPNFAQRAAGVAGILQHAAEQYTRETSLFASYVLDLQKRMGMQGQPIEKFVADLREGRIVPTEAEAAAAAKESITLTELVNGSAAAAMGARMSQSDLGYVIYLYKRHPLAMLSLLLETASRSFGPASEDRTLARKQVAGMATMLVGMSGLMGIPMAQQIAMLYDWLLADDDDPDFETVLRTSALGEVGTYGLLDWLLNMKVSNRLGYGGAIYKPAFGSEDLPPIYQVMEGLGGPVFGLLGKYTSGRAWDYYEDGQYGRAAEAAMPTSIANVFRAYRFATEGILNRNGNIMVEDVGPYSIAAQALGFMPTTYAQVLAKNSLGTRIDNAIRTKRTDLLRKLILAENVGDFDRYRDVMQEIQKFNQRHPGAAIDDETVKDSRTARARVNARTNHGLAVSPQNQRYIQSILDDFEKPTML